MLLSIRGPLLLVIVGALFICVAEDVNADEQISELVQIASQAESSEETELAITRLVTINTPAAANAVVNILDEKVLARSERLLPYLYIMYDNDVSQDANEIYAEWARSVDESDFDRFETALARGMRSKAGEVEATQALIAEHEKVSLDYKEWGYANYLLTILSGTNVDEASKYVVNAVLSNTDPAEKLRIEQILRDSGNHHSLHIMRKWPSVANGDFDLIVAEHYLASVAKFGDSQDAEFLSWIEKNSHSLFHPRDFEARIAPILELAQNRVFSSPSDSIGVNSRLIWALLLIVSGALAFYAFKRRQNADAAGD